MVRRIGRMIAWFVVGLVLLAIGLAIPVVYIETACRDLPLDDEYEPIVAESAFGRPEANTYLNYPEWHVIHVQEGLANVLKTGDEHDFHYTRSVVGFWQSFCELTRTATRHGATAFDSRVPIHLIGAGFTLEMLLKAVYEETLGRLFITNRGQQKTPQDLFAAQMADDYAHFMRRAPWYEYDFDGAVGSLWEEPLPRPMRGWERRLALGSAWTAKSAYARVVAETSDASGPDGTRVRAVITGLAAPQLRAVPGVTIAEDQAHYAVIETPGAGDFTPIMQQIAASGGRILEIAGNDDILVSLISRGPVPVSTIAQHRIISILDRDGFDGKRVLVSVKIPELAPLLVTLDDSVLELEHIYNY
jgi:hypothetical protein